MAHCDAGRDGPLPLPCCPLARASESVDPTRIRVITSWGTLVKGRRVHTSFEDSINRRSQKSIGTLFVRGEVGGRAPRFARGSSRNMTAPQARSHNGIRVRCFEGRLVRPTGEASICRRGPFAPFPVSQVTGPLPDNHWDDVAKGGDRGCGGHRGAKALAPLAPHKDIDSSGASVAQDCQRCIESVIGVYAAYNEILTCTCAEAQLLAQVSVGPSGLPQDDVKVEAASLPSHRVIMSHEVV